MMVRVGPALARGIVLAAALLAGGRLTDRSLPAEAPAPLALPKPDLDRALALVRSQDFVPLFDVAGRRIVGLFPPEREAAFLDELFSLSGKWKAVTRGEESYARYVRKTFERTVLSPRELETLVARVRDDYAYAVSAAENRLLVALYEDLRPSRPDLTLEAFRADHARLAARLAPLVARDLTLNLVSMAGSEVAAVLLVSALTSAGIVGAGAAAGPWTFGASLVAGIVAGIVIDAIVGEACEDAARAEVHREIQDLRNRIVDDVHDALARALLAWRRVEEACVRELYQGGSHGEVAAGPR